MKNYGDYAKLGRLIAAANRPRAWRVLTRRGKQRTVGRVSY